ETAAHEPARDRAGSTAGHDRAVTARRAAAEHRNRTRTSLDADDGEASGDDAARRVHDATGRVHYECAAHRRQTAQRSGRGRARKFGLAGAGAARRRLGRGVGRGRVRGDPRAKAAYGVSRMGTIRSIRLPRTLHPIAWWIWAIGLAIAASRTTNPLLLALILAVAGIVVAARRTEAPWARAFKWYLLFGLVVIAIRVAFRIVLGADLGAGERVLFTIPRIPLPGFLTGVELGGPVSAQSVLAAAYDGLRLATILCCIGAANTLANPKRALRSLPAALYELGVTITVAVTVAPQLVESAQRANRARKLRGATLRGRPAIRGTPLPVCERPPAPRFPPH